MSNAASSLGRIDVLKALGCCLIVLHHLSYYGPMTDHAAPLAPLVFAWLSEHARLAVQVFLVVGGYLAARSALRQSVPPSLDGATCARIIAQRFVRLALPLWAALVLAVVCNAIADHWMDHDSLSPAPDLWGIVVHLLLLQDLVGYEALSAGVWYVAIDFQLFALWTLLQWGAARYPQALGCLHAVVLATVLASAWLINRNPGWDIAAPYFWASYGLGILVALHAAGGPAVENRSGLCVLLGVIGVASAGLWDGRWLPWVAAGTACCLWLQAPGTRRWTPPTWIRKLSTISYAVFLVHFPVSLVINALWTTAVPLQPLLQLLGVITAFKLSVLVGAIFHLTVERLSLSWSRSWFSAGAS